jgi:hypothetical protein
MKKNQTATIKKTLNNPKPVTFNPEVLNVNNKNRTSRGKVETHNVPLIALAAMGDVMTFGAGKHGEYNYLESDITASVFMNGMMRHIMDWWNREDFAEDSDLHHLAHMMSGAAIVLAGMQYGNFVDDRPPAAMKSITGSRDVWRRAPGNSVQGRLP